MSGPSSSIFDALQAHFKGQSPQRDPRNDGDGELGPTRPVNPNQGHQTIHLGFGRPDLGNPPPVSQTPPPLPSYYIDPLLVADDGYHNRHPSGPPVGRGATAQNKLVSILPKPSPTSQPQTVFDSQMNAASKRMAEEGLVDPRLRKAAKSDYPILPDMETAVQQSGATETSTGGLNYFQGVSNAFDVEGDVHPTGSATDALLERQMGLQNNSDEESDAENRGEYDEDDDEEPQRTGRRRGRGRGRAAQGRGIKRGPRKAAEPTGDVKYRINMAQEAYLNGRIDDAIEWVEDAIRINAEICRAWTLLSTLFMEKGDYKKSFTARVFSCHLQPKDVQGWLNAAELGLQLLDEYPEDATELREQSSVCYSAALRANITCTQARHGRAAISVERRQFRTAAKDYLYLLEHCEYDVYALRPYAEMTIMLASIGKRGYYTPESAIEWYRRAFAYFRENGPSERFPLDWQDVNIFVGVLAYIEHTKDALYEVKSLSRWLLGRSDDTFWDDWQDDDREWDVDNVRRLGIEGYQEGKYPESSYGSGLPLMLRTKMAVCRLRLGDLDEAQYHIHFVDPEGPNGNQVLINEPHLVAEVALALYEADLRPIALRLFEPLLSIPDVLDSASLLAAGRCYLDAGDKRQAEECFSAAIDEDESNDEASIDARYELAKMYEAAREEQEAYILVNEALRLQQDQDESEYEYDEEEMDDYPDSDDNARYRVRKQRPKKRRAPRTSKPRAPRAPKPKSSNPKDGARRPRPRRKVFGRSEEAKLEDKRRAEELAAAWRTVHSSRNAAQDDDAPTGPSDAFMQAAKKLVDDFRSCKGFYSWEKYLTHLGIDEDKQVFVSRNRNLIEMKERLSQNLNPFGPNDERQLGERTAVSYRGVSFSEWLDLFLEYAVGLAHYENYQESYQVCESARDAEVFAKNKDDMFLIHIIWAACALRARDEETCVAVARFLMRDRQFDSDPFRLFAALCRLCPSRTSWYASGPVQKYMLRQIKLMDRALAPGGGEDSEEEEAKGSGGRVYPSNSLDVTLLVLYGHILFVSNSFTYALNYFLRAYSIDPTNQMILLSVGQCYIHYALKRQSENRQYLLIQGFVFLHCYYDNKASSSDTAERQEAHYNMARSYHAIGIPHLAAEYYQRVLRDVPEDSGSEVLGRSDISHEAAYNLQQICWAGGDLEAVKQLSEKYLTL